MKHNVFTIFEHEALYVDEVYNGNTFTHDHYVLLEQFFKEKKFPYYRLVRKGARFCEYVGVIQVGNMLIEVLPKADRNQPIAYEEKEEINNWRTMLIDMLKSVGIFDIHAPSSSNLKLKSNSLLDLYFELFIVECETLLHKGLIKRYRKTEKNSYALKGNLLFGKHIQHNLVHQERFYTRTTIYDQQHQLNSILYKTLRLLKQINTSQQLNSRIGSLLLSFPELPDLRVTEAIFEKIQYNRKNNGYRKAIQISKLLLLNYHPDVQSGRNDLLTLMFDMNLLWEKFVYKSLLKYNEDSCFISPQSSKNFWQKLNGRPVNMRPDIVITKKNGEQIVLDTKWKNIQDANPSPDDLRQMYAYSKFHSNAVTALVYPGAETITTQGAFLNEQSNDQQDKACNIVKINVNLNIQKWQEDISIVLLNI
jgi:5-methylcytosine-specific restriction enzyme subunit McrC